MSVFILKIIALVSMIIDHFGAVFGVAIDRWIYTHFQDPSVYLTSYGLRVIGRIAFPIYAYLIAEGCRYTKNIKRFLFRLLIFAFISEIPYDLALSDSNRGIPVFGKMPLFFDFSNQNVYFTLFLGALSIYIFQQCQQRTFPYWQKILFSFLGVSTLAIAAKFLLFTDYGAVGVLTIFFIYIMPTKASKLMVLIFSIAYLYLSMNIWMFAAAFISVALLFCYQGKQGPKFQTFFYWAYPLHLALFAYIWLIYIRFNTFSF